MMGLEKVVLADLEEQLVYDVYWAYGRLHYLNEWDEGIIRQVLRDKYPLVSEDILVADHHGTILDPYATINS